MYFDLLRNEYQHNHTMFKRTLRLSMVDWTTLAGISKRKKTGETFFSQINLC